MNHVEILEFGSKMKDHSVKVSQGHTFMWYLECLDILRPWAHWDPERVSSCPHTPREERINITEEV